MDLTINGCRLNVEDLGPRDAPLIIAHHGGGGIGSLQEPKDTFGPLADEYRVIVFDARGCGASEAIAPYSHAQWAADVDALREWAGAEKVTVAGGSYGGFISLEYALAYPDRVEAVMLRDTAADGSNLEIAFENARNQNRIEVEWDNFNRYWSGQMRDDADLKQCWSEMIGLYDHDYDPERSAPLSRRAATGTKPTTGASSRTGPATTSRTDSEASRSRCSSPSVATTGSPRSARRRRSLPWCRTPSS